MTTKPRQPPILRAYEKTNTQEPAESQHDVPFLEYRGENLPVADIPDQSVDPAMLSQLSMDLNSRTQLPPKLTDEALIQTAENYLNQCSAGGAAATYEGMLLQHIVPELVERLKEKDESPETPEKTDR